MTRRIRAAHAAVTLSFLALAASTAVAQQAGGDMGRRAGA
jgi:hypothetical protein